MTAFLSEEDIRNSWVSILRSPCTSWADFEARLQTLAITSGQCFRKYSTIGIAALNKRRLQSQSKTEERKRRKIIEEFPPNHFDGIERRTYTCTHTACPFRFTAKAVATGFGTYAIEVLHLATEVTDMQVKYENRHNHLVNVAQVGQYPMFRRKLGTDFEVISLRLCYIYGILKSVLEFSFSHGRFERFKSRFVVSS